MNLEELTPVTAAVIFLGAPLAVVGLIWLAVLLATRSAQRRAARGATPTRSGDKPPPGAVPVTGPDGAGGGEPSWTVRCTACVQTYRRNGKLAQFENSDTAIRTALRHDWSLHADGIRCPGCTRVGLTR